MTRNGGAKKTPHTLERRLTAENIDQQIQGYISEIKQAGASLKRKKGLKLLHELKRGKTGFGKYSDVSLFEAANRAMTDLVILRGVRWMLRNEVFPYDSYNVEFGNENSNDHDIEATSSGERLIGEAFNVAPSFFQGKKSIMLKKIARTRTKATHKILMFNDDAIDADYKGSPPKGVIYIVVNVLTGACRSYPGAKSSAK